MSRGSACGSTSNASTARNLSSSAGPIPKAGDPISGASLLVYYDPDGRLVYAGRAGTGINGELTWVSGQQAQSGSVVSKRRPLEPSPRPTVLRRPSQRWVVPSIHRASW
jgi:hypothetical protein